MNWVGEKFKNRDKIIKEVESNINVMFRDNHIGFFK